MESFIGIIVSQTGEQVIGERYVGTTHVAIQDAVDYCNSMGGGKIFIEKGTYDIQQPINLYSNIEIYGESFGTILKPSFANSGSVGCLQAIGVSGAELENIYIHDLLIGNTEGTKVGRYGIYCSYVGLAQTTGLTSGDYSRYDSSTVGVNKPNKIGVRIENCYIQNNSGHGISLSSSSNNTITGNTIQNNSYQGIYLHTSSNNTVTGNTVQNNNSIGIYLYSSSNSTITGNTVQNNSSQGIFLNGSNNTITGNTVQNNGNYGIRLNGSDNTITGNTVQNNNSYGIYLQTSSNNNTITGNISRSNSSTNFYVSTSNYNLINGNSYGSSSFSGTGNDTSENIQQA